MPAVEFNPSEVRHLLSADMKRDVARGASKVIQDVYQGNYPLPAQQDSDNFYANIRDGSMHVFTLLDEDSLERPEVLALATIVEEENKLGGPVQFAELGRAGKRTHYTESVRDLLVKRVDWARQHLRTLHFLESTTRSAGRTHSGITVDGKGVQSVWWGSRRYGQNLDLMTTRVGWDYRLGEIEPFTSFAIPLDSREWQQANRDKTTFVPNEEQADRLLTSFYEHSGGAFVPKIDIATQAHSIPDPKFRITQEGSDIVTGKFSVTDHSDCPGVSLDGVEKQLAHSFSQVITLEADWATEPKGAVLADYLESNGWTLTGWEPSRLEHGVICPTFGRVNPRELDYLIDPTHHPQYYDDAGLAGTRQHMDNIYEEMKAKAA